MGIILAKDLNPISIHQYTLTRREKRSSNHDQLPLYIPRPLQTIIILPLPQRLAVDIRRKEASRSFDALVQGTPIRQVSSQTHTRCANSAVAGWEGQEVVDGEGGVFVVCGEFLDSGMSR